MSSADEREPNSGGGCLPLVAACLIATILFLVNGVVFQGVYKTLVPRSSRWLQHDKVAQILYFVMPLVMLVVEWWLVDRLRSLVRRRRG